MPAQYRNQASGATGACATPAASSTAATRSARSSRHGAAITCTPIGAEWFEVNGQRLPVRPSMGMLTQPISCIGLPVCGVPVWGGDESLPIGVQIIAAPWREDLALRVAAVLEAAGVSQAPVAPLK